MGRSVDLGAGPRRQRSGIGGVVVLTVALLALAGFGAMTAWYMASTVRPAMESIAEVKARATVTLIVNQAIGQNFGRIDASELLHTAVDAEGNITMVQTDTARINAALAELSKEIQERYNQAETQVIRVPVGSLMKNSLLSQVRPFVNLKVIPISVTAADFQTEFEDAGINQTKYKVYVTLTSQVRVVAPFMEETYDTKVTVPVAEAIIVGRVPASYVNIPEEDITDFIGN